MSSNKQVSKGKEAEDSLRTSFLLKLKLILLRGVIEDNKIICKIVFLLFSVYRLSSFDIIIPSYLGKLKQRSMEKKTRIRV